MNFQQGISGLNAAAKNLEVIGNNIANANTIGAKEARAEFADIYASEALRQVGGSAGMGVRVASVTQQFTQGGLRTTDNPLDVAINGHGFFVVTPPGGGDPGYTRNGQFQVDAQGYLVNGDNLRVQGYGVDAATGNVSGVVGDIRLPTAGMGAAGSTKGKIEMNLDATTPAPATTMPAFGLKDPSSYTSSTSIKVYDQQGTEHVASLYFRRTSTDNQWDVYASMDGTAVPAGSGAQVPAGRLTFKPDGSLDATASGTLDASGALTAGDLNLDLPFAASTLPMAPSTSTTSAPFKLSFEGSTQFGTGFGVTHMEQDGHAPGQLTGIAVDANGNIQARYSNGVTQASARVALASFANDQGLVSVGGNLWRATPESGAATLGTPGSASLGQLQGGALEESNIDLTQQLVDMISAQRSYQANAQTIKTQDQMLSSLLNMR